MNKEKRMLIHQDDKLLNRVCTDIRQFSPLLGELKKSYDSLQIDRFNDKIFKDMLSHGSDVIAERYGKSLEKQLDSLKIKSDIMRKNLISEHNIYIENFKEALLNLTSFYPETYTYESRPVLSLQYISFADGSFQISKNQIEEILETHCRTYLVTDIEKRAYKTLNKMNDAYYEFKNILGEVGYSQFRGLESMHVFIKDTRIPELKPKEVKGIFDFVEKQRVYQQGRIDKQS